MNPTKLLIIGDGGVGKTSFVKRLRNLGFDFKYTPTLGVEVNTISFPTRRGTIVFNVWDCGGEHKGLGEGYYIGAGAVVIMFDLGEKASFIKVVKELYTNLVRVIGNRIPIVLCGNKWDRESVVESEEIERFIRGKNMRYYNISAMDNYHIRNVVSYLVEKL